MIIRNDVPKTYSKYYAEGKHHFMHYLIVIQLNESFFFLQLFLFSSFIRQKYRNQKWNIIEKLNVGKLFYETYNR